MTSDFPEFYDVIYVISLQSSLDRRAHIVDHFASIGISNYKFFDATPADSEPIRTLFDQQQVFSYPPCFRCGKAECGIPDCNNVIIAPQVAVYHTYLRLWEQIVITKERALICEDDIVFNPWWRDVFLKICDKIRDGSLIFERQTPTLLRLGWAKNAEHNADQKCRA